jgi:uncharacterized protein (TIGR03437 family)
MAFAASAPVSTSSPAHPGQVLTLWAAGLGLVSNPSDDSAPEAGVQNAQGDLAVQIPVTATVNGMPAEVVSATLPAGSIGVYQVRVILPPPLTGLASTAILTISQESRASNSVTIPIGATVE